MSKLTPFFNPVAWFKAWRFHKKNAAFDKSTYDLELHLYSKILNNNMLHWGYFENIQADPGDISLKQFEAAQQAYARNLLAQIADKKAPVLDVGCGMGGLAEMLRDHSIPVEVLTPNKNQISFISQKHPELCHHRCKFEDFEAVRHYGTIINSESLQYIKLEEAFNKVDSIVLPKARWIITDYFRTGETTDNKGSHLLSDFKQKISEHGWNIVLEKDITANVLPTIAYVNLHIERFLLPLRHYAYEKLRYKQAWLFYLSERIRKSIDAKIDKERRSVDPALFVTQKRYMFFVLEK
ncbi:MAG: SAM-dependent methyltransferase [Bacteroidales bacterium]|nr:SAM-dependent methyltransferase [Bacteroidales bacterium]